MPESTIQTAVELIALRRFGLIAPIDAVHWAADHLVEEPTPAALLELACLPERVEAADVDPLLERLLDDEGTSMDRREAGLVVARLLARRIVDGSLKPVSGANMIDWEIGGNVVELFEELSLFGGLASEWEDNPKFRADYERDIITAAARLLADSDPASPTD